MPTVDQALRAVVLCQWLSNCYRQINVFRYDSKLRTIYIQAGTSDEIALVIFADGNWRLV